MSDADLTTQQILLTISKAIFYRAWRSSWPHVNDHDARLERLQKVSENIWAEITNEERRL